MNKIINIDDIPTYPKRKKKIRKTKKSHHKHQWEIKNPEEGHKYSIVGRDGLYIFVMFDKTCKICNFSKRAGDSFELKEWRKIKEKIKNGIDNK
ncbi:MAG: hypothetical protein PHP92_03960 [Candidatus Nanoarchaeia archaeon]|nr:hypothetical protein [Candidatus Nanoarchaeia archaeon]